MQSLGRGVSEQLMCCWNVLACPEFLKDIDAVWAGLAGEGPMLARIWINEYTALIGTCYRALTSNVTANEGTDILFDLSMLKMAWLHTVIPTASRLTI